MRTPSELLNTPSRPLWSLRCTREEYDALRQAVRSTPAQAVGFPKLLVLAAAETIRREYRGGAWTWALVVQSLNLRCSDAQLVEWVEAGLVAWRRPVRRGRDGSRLRLSSLICEGGIATYMIAAEGGILQDWCRSVPRDMKDLGLTGDEPDAELAEVAARRRGKEA